MLYTFVEFRFQGNYKADYRTTAINQGGFIKKTIEESMFELSSESQRRLSSMAVKAFPL
jgi:hypothetical protein